MKGLKPSSKVIRLNREHPNYYHAGRLKVTLDSWVFRLERIRMADDCPIGYQITFVPEKLCPDLANYDFSKESLYDISEKIYNHVLSWQETVVKPVIANEHLAQMLNIRPRSPLLLTESISYLAGGTPFESNFNFYLSERYQFTVLSYRQNSINAAEEK
jgi:GntR family transcriptional regulator